MFSVQCNNMPKKHLILQVLVKQFTSEIMTLNNHVSFTDKTANMRY